MTSMLLVGAFGQGNPGDEALLGSFLDALHDHDVAVVTRTPSQTADRFGCETVPRDALSVLRAVGVADVVVAAGGTIFKLLHPSTGRDPLDLLLKTALLTSSAKAAGKLVALVGVGAGHLDGRAPRALARRIVRRADLMILRDEESAAILAEAGVPGPFRIGADAAWSTLRDTPQPVRRTDPIVVALSHHAGDERLAGRLACALAPLVEGGARIELQPWQATADPDQRLAREVRRLLDDRVSIIGAPSDLDHARRLFARRRAVVGLRFHALVAAAAARTPFVGVAHEPKLAALCRRLRQPSVEVGPEELGRGLRCALAGPGPDDAAIADQIAHADDGFRLLRLLDPRTQGHALEDLEGLALYQPPC